MSLGDTIHFLISSADSLPPTPSSGVFLFPLPSIAWHMVHFWAAKTVFPFEILGSSWARTGTAVIVARATLVREIRTAFIVASLAGGRAPADRWSRGKRNHTPVARRRTPPPGRTPAASPEGGVQRLDHPCHQHVEAPDEPVGRALDRHDARAARQRRGQ